MSLNIIPPIPQFKEMQRLVEDGELQAEAFTSKEDRIAWMKELLRSTEYLLLSKEEKGIIRQYIQAVTGYSRAQMARHITTCTREGGMEVVQLGDGDRFRTFPRLSFESRRSLALGVMVVALLVGGGATLANRWTATAQPEAHEPQDPQIVYLERDFEPFRTNTSTVNTVERVTERIVQVTERTRRSRPRDQLPEVVRHFPEREVAPVQQSVLIASGPQWLRELTAGAREGQHLTFYNGELVWRYTTPPVVRVSGGGGGGYSPVRRGGGSGGPNESSDGRLEKHDHQNDDTGGQLAINGATFGTLVTSRGGTGLSWYSTGHLLVGTSTGSLRTLELGSNGQVLTVSNGGVAWGSAGAGDLTQSAADDRYVNTSGDTMTGSLTVHGTISGSTLSGAYVSAERVHASTSITSSGTLSVDGAAVLASTLSVSGNITLNGVTYTFPYSDGTATGKVLKTDGAGNLVWSNDIDTGGAGTLNTSTGSLHTFFQTEFDERFVNTSGDTMTGALTIKRVSGTYQNLLTVSGGRIIVQTTAPNNSIDLIHVSGGSLAVSGNGNFSGALLAVGNISTRGDFTLNIDQTAANVTITFGSDSTNETLRWLNNEDRFEFSDDVHVTGSLTTSGALIATSTSLFKADLIINSDSGAADAVLTFGSDGTNETITFINSEDVFEFSDDLNVTGRLAVSGALVVEAGQTVTLNSVTYTFPYSDGTATGKVLKTDGAGNLVWSNDNNDGGSGLSYADAVSYFVDDSGDTMTGSLDVKGNLSGIILHARDVLSSSGTLDIVGSMFTNADLTLNDDADSNDVTITFDSDSTAETFKWLNAEDRFEFSDDVHVTGSLATSGALIVEAGQTVTLNSVTYTFPYSDGTASGKVLHTDGAGNLVWSDDDGAGAGLTYSEAVGYFVDDSGDTMTGALTIKRVSGTYQNLLTVSGGRIIVQTTAPNNSIDLIHVSGGSLAVSGNGNFSGALLVVGNIVSRGNLTLNEDQTAADTILTFGSDGTNETITFINSEDVFEFSDDLNVTGRLAVSGALIVEAGQTVTLNGVTYTFPYSDGTATGKVLKTDGAGNLVWSNDNNDGGSGLSYADAVSYFVDDSGDTMTGALTIKRVSGTYQNLLTVSGGRIVVQTTNPDNSVDLIHVSGGSLAVSGNASVSGALLVVGNIQSRGTISGAYLHASSGITTSGGLIIERVAAGTGILVEQTQSGVPLVALDGYARPGTASGSPHIIFGYQGLFDVKMYRNETGSLWVSSNTGNTLVVRTEMSDGTDALQVISNGGDVEFRVQANGQVRADGTFTGGGADYAEYFYASDSDLVSGDVVCLDLEREGTVQRCRRSADSNVMGIISTQPAFVGNKFGDFDGIAIPQTALVGLIGQVPAKAIVEATKDAPAAVGKKETNESTEFDGRIRVGDSLTPAAKPGYVRKAEPGEPTVGVALQKLESGEGVIEVLISRRNSSLTVETVEQEVLDTIAAMEIEDEVQMMVADALSAAEFDSRITDEVHQQVSSIDIAAEVRAVLAEEQKVAEQHRDNSPLRVSVTEGVQVDGHLSVSGALAAEDIQTRGLEVDGYASLDTVMIQDRLTVLKDTRMSGDLHLEGELLVNDLFIPGAVRIDGSGEVTGSFAVGSLTAGSGSRIDGLLKVAGDLQLSEGSLFMNTGSVLHAHDLLVDNAVRILGPVTVHGLAVFLNDVQVHGVFAVSGALVVNNNQAGYAVIPVTGVDVSVRFSNGHFLSTPVVTASPSVPVLYGISPATKTGFSIRLREPAQEDILFSWIALGTWTPRTFTGNGTVVAIQEFFVDSLGYPLSDSEIWNLCIRNQVPIDEETGKPFNCNRYHEDDIWTHPESGLEFTWNLNRNPRLQLPDGWVIVTREDPVELESKNDDGQGEDESEETDIGSGELLTGGDQGEENGTGTTIEMQQDEAVETPYHGVSESGSTMEIDTSSGETLSYSVSTDTETGAIHSHEVDGEDEGGNAEEDTGTGSVVEKEGENDKSEDESEGNTGSGSTTETQQEETETSHRDVSTTNETGSGVNLQEGE